MSTPALEQFPIMQGEARMAVGAGYFEVPLFSHIKDNLWMGCSPSEFPDEHEEFNYEWTRAAFIRPARPVNCHWLTVEKAPRFDVIFNLYVWGEYKVPAGTDQFSFEMFDGDDVNAEQVDEIADRVVKWLEGDTRVLVHCQAGLNRSSLVVARTLMKQHGLTADEAIALIREQRSPVCICNPSFEHWLRAFDN